MTIRPEATDREEMGRAVRGAAATGLPGADLWPLVVSIVINYRGLEQTRTCVASLIAADYPNHSVVVVDNASGGLEVDALRESLGNSIRIIRAERNRGYGGGANLGLEWARREGAAYAWVLNNDTKVDSGAVRELVESMERETSFGILSPRIDAPVGPEAPFGIWYAGGKVDLARALATHQILPDVSSPAIEPTGFVTGCAMFLRLQALDVTGLFWEPLFLYWEDVDLSLRMRRAGWRLGVVPAARVFHSIHGSVQSKTYRYYSSRNAILVAKRYLHGRGAARATLWVAARALKAWALRGGPVPIAEARGLIVGVAMTLHLGRLIP
jgi:GT2 family glycosyltransferase